MQKNNYEQPICDCKKTLRAHMRQQRKAQPVVIREQASVVIQECVLESELWQKARRVGLYMAMEDEVQTNLLVQRAWQEGKELYLPLCRKEAYGEMDFVHCVGAEDVAEGSFGIFEPTTTAIQRQGAMLQMEDVNSALDILLVPGVAFDAKGYRVGFGGGYYDRFLQHMVKQKTICIGVAFSWQMVLHMTHDTWDIPMHALVTEKGLQWI